MPGMPCMCVRVYGQILAACAIFVKAYMDRALLDIETLLKALADVTRLRILGLLLTGEVCVCHIHESLRISQPKASRHLAYLRRAGLVSTRRDGLWIHYRLADVCDPVLRTVRDAVTHALGHVEAIHRDAARLRKKTGACLPASSDLTLACCGAAGKSVEEPALTATWPRRKRTVIAAHD